MNKQYKDKFGYIHELPTKENEVKKFNHALKEALYLANSQKPEISKYAEFPKTFFDRKKQNDAAEQQKIE
jgi:hypothetical protein